MVWDESSGGGGVSSGLVYEGRGDPSAYDWVLTDLTTDDIWHDLDCSGIVDSEAQLIRFRVKLQGTAGWHFTMRENGLSHDYETQIVNVPVSAQDHYANFTVPCDSNQVIEYLASNAAWTTISICITGWFKSAS